MPREGPEVLSFRADRVLALRARLRAAEKSESLSRYLRQRIEADLRHEDTQIRKAQQ